MALRDNFKDISVTGNNGAAVNLGASLDGILNAARDRLQGLLKNNFEHSHRLERYMDTLSGMLTHNPLTPGESFVLLCAAYLHDIGYWHEGAENGQGHQLRSASMLRAQWRELGFAEFHPMGNAPSPIVEAIARVCHAHAPEGEVRLNSLEPMQVHDLGALNIKKLAALMRIADEADDPYIRIYGYNPTRSHINRVAIENHKVIWHWDQSNEGFRQRIKQLHAEKKDILHEARAYLMEHCGAQVDFIVQPDPDARRAFNVPEVVEGFIGRGEYIDKLMDNLHDLRCNNRRGLLGMSMPLGAWARASLPSDLPMTSRASSQTGCTGCPFERARGGRLPQACLVTPQA